MKPAKDKYIRGKAGASAAMLIVTCLLIYFIREERIVMISLVAALMILLLLKIWYDFVDVCKERDILRNRAHKDWGIGADELNTIAKECNNAEQS